MALRGNSLLPNKIYCRNMKSAAYQYAISTLSVCNQYAIDSESRQNIWIIPLSADIVNRIGGHKHHTITENKAKWVISKCLFKLLLYLFRNINGNKIGPNYYKKFNYDIYFAVETYSKVL